MLLIGMFDSPFVRRVAISMKLLGFDYEHRNWSIGKDFEHIAQYNPLVRVPTLVLDSGEILSESLVILQYLDEQVGAERALLPTAGEERWIAMQMLTWAMGACDFAREIIYERSMRPADKQHAPWIERRMTQMHGALTEVECRIGSVNGDPWFLGKKIGQVDITCACAFSFLADALPLPDKNAYPALQEHAARCEERPEFKETFTPFFNPATKNK